jgi:hypothetical protein
MNEVPELKFLGIQIDNKLNWKSHVEYILPKLSSAIFVIRGLSYFMNSETLQMVYFSYFHSIIKYRIIFWGNSTNISRVFKLQKKVIRIISGVGPRDSCRGLFRKLDILPLSCEYMLSWMLFVVDNQNNFRSGFEVPGLNTRSKNQLYLPTTNLSVFQKGANFLVLGYLIACLRPFKVLEMMEFILKITCFHISWLIHFILLLNSWNIQ